MRIRTKPATSATIAAGALAGLLVVGPAVAAASTPPDSDAADVDSSLTPGGEEFAAGIDWATQPDYRLTADLDPATGAVDATMTATLPVGAAATELRMRWFAGVVADDAALRDVTVDQAASEPEIDQSMITLPLADGHDDTVEVSLAFSYTAPELEVAPSDAAGGGGEDGLQPADIGLLARSEAGLMLGHWFPVWLPDGVAADAEIDGYGDISNFPAASIVAEVTVPDDTVVVSGGSRLGEAADGAIIEGGVGLRDLAISVLTDVNQETVTAGDTEVIVTTPAGVADVEVVADVAADSVTTLSDEFGPYPWADLDVVAVPLGSGVGGMEWPGMVWIETAIFEGGVPGLDGVVGEGELAELLGGFEELFGVGGDLGLMLETLREWTVAHEIGHMWWHALVGNDSLEAPVVDEALAQHSACIVTRVRRPGDANAVCDAHTKGQFEQLQSMLGVPDAAADQSSDDFESSEQYGAVVYGKAPLFYRELEADYGVEETAASLADVVADYAFDQLTPDQLRMSLGQSLDDPAGVDALWARWMHEAHGADDL